MEAIIKKAIAGGYDWWKSAYPTIEHTKEECEEFLLNDWEKPSHADLVCDKNFWQSLGRACKLRPQKSYKNEFKERVKAGWEHVALNFHEINLTEGWAAAVKYLSEITSA